MKLLIETINEPLQVLQEGVEGKKRLYLNGPMLQANRLNRNNRYYNKPILQNEVARYTRDYVAKGRAVGELNHPAHPNVDPERGCHKIVSLTEDGDNWIGKSEVLTELPMGKIVEGYHNSGITLAVSTRGLGTLQEKDGANHVNDDYHLVCVDVVFDPSGPDCFVNGLMEGAEWLWNPIVGQWQILEQIKKDVLALPANRLEEGLIEAFDRFMGSL